MQHSSVHPEPGTLVGLQVNYMLLADRKPRTGQVTAFEHNRVQIAGQSAAHRLQDFQLLQPA